MKFNDLRLKIGQNGLFSLEDIFKWAPQAKRSTVKNQLSGWASKGYLLRLRKNLYFLQSAPVKEEFFLANQIYKPSYVSLESALNYYGIIPDIPLAVTSVTLKKTQEFKNEFGLFSYRTLKPALFWGWQVVEAGEEYFYKIARPEKALFDFLWLNQKNFGQSFPQEERFSLKTDFNWQLFKKYASVVKIKKFKQLVKKLETLK